MKLHARSNWWGAVNLHPLALINNASKGSFCMFSGAKSCSAPPAWSFGYSSWCDIKAICSLPIPDSGHLFIQTVSLLVEVQPADWHVNWQWTGRCHSPGLRWAHLHKCCWKLTTGPTWFKLKWWVTFMEISSHLLGTLTAHMLNSFPSVKSTLWGQTKRKGAGNKLYGLGASR